MEAKNVYDEKGNVEYNKWKPEYHRGFPAKYGICHEGMDDVGGPTYWRLG
jgi:hypothetical protein